MDYSWPQVLAFFAILAAAATPYFFIFWTWFDFWREHVVLTYMVFSGVFIAFGLTVLVFDRTSFAGRLDLPLLVEALGWLIIAASSVFGFLADRQIGFRVRSFMPFFEHDARITLRTTGAYGVVRHPIYASGIGFYLGVFLVTGYPSVLSAWAVFTLGAFWFSRQEEIRLMGLLDDPDEYERYRARVPALIPRLIARRRTSASPT